MIFASGDDQLGENVATMPWLEYAAVMSAVRRGTMGAAVGT